MLCRIKKFNRLGIGAEQAVLYIHILDKALHPRGLKFVRNVMVNSFAQVNRLIEQRQGIDDHTSAGR